MNYIKAKKLDRIKSKPSKKGWFFYTTIILSCFIMLFCLNLSSFKFSKDFMQSLKNAIQTIKPTEELFDDNGGVKLVSILFPTTSQEVSNQILNFEFKLDSYDNSTSDDGIITLYNPSGLIYAVESGVVHIAELDDDNDEIKIVHGLDTQSVYAGKFIFGVNDGQIVEKGEPLAVIMSPKIQFCIMNNDEVVSNISLVQGALSWVE